MILEVALYLERINILAGEKHLGSGFFFLKYAV